MTYEAIIADLKAKKYAPVYLLHGEESYFIDKISQYIEANVLSESEKAFNQIVMYGKEVTSTQVTDNARQYPMMAERRVVVVKEAQAMSKMDQMVSYVEKPSPQTILVINHKHKKMDGRSKLTKAIKGKGVVFESKKLYDNKVAGWITSEIAARGKSIQPQAANMMAEYLGADLSKISNEIDKILVNLKDASVIDVNTVQTQVGITKDYNVFELQKALSQGDAARVFKIVKYFGNNPKAAPLVMVLSSLYGYFRKVYAVAYYLGKKKDNELASLVGVSPYFVSEYKQAAKNFPARRLVGIFAALSEADLKSKGVGSRGTSENEVLRELMIKIFYEK